MQTRYYARNFDERARRAAEDAARALSVDTGRRFVVEYQDHYDDSRVAGDYVIRERF
jgi:hypothetical protein